MLIRSPSARVDGPRAPDAAKRRGAPFVSVGYSTSSAAVADLFDDALQIGSRLSLCLGRTGVREQRHHQDQRHQHAPTVCKVPAGEVASGPAEKESPAIGLPPTAREALTATEA